MKEITEKTLIPLSFVVTLGGGVFWLTSIYTISQANTSSIVLVQAKQDKFEDALGDIKEDLAKIKGLLEAMKK